MSQIIIGLTGPFGSGTKLITQKILEPTYGVKVINLSDLIRESSEFTEFIKNKGKGYTVSRTDMQNFGDILRKKYKNYYLAEKAFEKIKKLDGDAIIVVRGLKNIDEVNYFRRLNQIPFYLFAITADISDGVRASFSDIDNKHKVKGRRRRVYNNYVTKGSYSEKQYELDEERDRESKDDNGDVLPHGQQVLKCYQDADIIIDNSFEISGIENFRADNPPNVFKILKETVTRYIDYILIKEKRGDKVFRRNGIGAPLLDKFVPFQQESCMVMAYANSLKSQCLKRKVGAIIANRNGDVISSGYNEVPRGKNTEACRSPDAGSRCARDMEREKYVIKLKEYTKAKGINCDKLSFSEVCPKMLELCRALHAEERAILSLAINGNRLDGDLWLYATTFTCNLCANKVVEMGIKNIVYSEPYPVESAKKILNDGEVNVFPYQGVTHKGYFRLMEDNK